MVEQFKLNRILISSPPGGLISEALSDYTKSFAMSVVLGDDIVPRLSLRSVHNLKASILKHIYRTAFPKYKIIWKYSLSFVKTDLNRNNLSSYSSDEDEDEDKEEVVENDFITTKIAPEQAEEQIINIDSNDRENLFSSTSLVFKEDTQNLKQNAYSYFSKPTNIVDIADFDISNKHEKKEHIESSTVACELIKKMRRHVKEAYPNLVLPGNILYIYKIESNRPNKSYCGPLCSKIFCCFNLCKKTGGLDFDSRWACRSEFKKILITNRMLLDHFPNTLDNALNYFNSTKFYL